MLARNVEYFVGAKRSCEYRKDFHDYWENDPFVSQPNLWSCHNWNQQPNHQITVDIILSQKLRCFKCNEGTLADQAHQNIRHRQAKQQRVGGWIKIRFLSSDKHDSAISKQGEYWAHNARHHTHCNVLWSELPMNFQKKDTLARSCSSGCWLMPVNLFQYILKIKAI